MKMYSKNNILNGSNILVVSVQSRRPINGNIVLMYVCEYICVCVRTYECMYLRIICVYARKEMFY